jgi:two-component system chemotaxis response regulator CheB
MHNGNDSDNDTRIVTIGASAGGVRAISDVVAGLPADIDAAVFVVIHVGAGRTSRLPSILERSGALPAAHATDGEAIRRGRIFVAPPDCHLMLNDGRVRVARGPYENYSRPAIDPLFRSAALNYGSRVIAVILSGQLDDGASGMTAVRECGGTCIVQDPRDAEFPSMPEAAIALNTVDYTASATRIGAIIAGLAREPAPPARENGCDRGRLEREVRIASMDIAAPDEAPSLGKPSIFGCPDCGGVLWEQDDDAMMRFRCLVGHAYSPETLIERQDETVEQALWVAYRTLCENAAAAGRVANRLRTRGLKGVRNRFDTRREHLERSAESVRKLLTQAPDEVE